MNMTTTGTERPTIYLRSGEIHFTDQPGVVITVLGSCVSVTLFHRRSGLSAICHGLLPHCRSRHVCGRNCADAAKYVECSLRTIMEQFKQFGVKLSELEAGIYGGADMFGMSAALTSRFSVGKQNVETAIKRLQHEGVPVHTIDVGGNRGRKIYFNTQTGGIQLVHLQPTVVLAGNGGNGKAK